MEKSNNTLFKFFKSISPYHLGFSIALYYLFLILFTDGIIWQQSQKLGEYKWSDLILYSLMSYPYWMLIASKSYLAEIADIKSGFKWSNVDLLPRSNVFFFTMTFLSGLLKMRIYQLWLLSFFIVCFWKTQNLALSIVIIIWLLIGVLNLTLMKIFFSYLSPRGYENLIAAFFHSTFWVLSGAAFPLSFLKISDSFKFYSPISLVVGLPLEIFLNPSISVHLPTLHITAIGIIWSIILYLINRTVEERWRTSFYV